MATTIKVTLYREEMPVADGRAAGPPEQLEFKLLTALMARLGSYTLKKGEALDSRMLYISRYNQPQVSARIELDNIHSLSRSYGNGGIMVRAGRYGDRFQRRYAIEAKVEKNYGVWTYAYLANVPGLLQAVDAAIDHAAKIAEQEDAEAKARRAADAAIEARRNTLALLLGLAPDGFSMSAGMDGGGMVYHVTIPLKPMTGRVALPYLSLFPDARFDLHYAGLNLRLPEAMLDAALAKN